jgi:hypothetical protein
MRAYEKSTEQENHIAGPCYIVDEEGTVVAEGICCLEHAKVMAAGQELREALEAILEWADPFALPNCERNEQGVKRARAILDQLNCVGKRS